jgi:hypothetical protein
MMTTKIMKHIKSIPRKILMHRKKKQTMNILGEAKTSQKVSRNMKKILKN